MKKIPSEKIEDGMTLGRDVCGPSGNILVSKGTPLTAALGRRLTNWGIHFVYIEGEEETATIVTAPDFSPDELKSRLTAKFSNCMDNSLMKKLFVAVYEFRLKSNNN